MISVLQDGVELLSTDLVLHELDDVVEVNDVQDGNTVFLADGLGGALAAGVAGGLHSVQGDDDAGNDTLLGLDDVEGLVDRGTGGHDVVNNEHALILELGPHNGPALAVILLLLSVERVTDVGVLFAAQFPQLNDGDGR